MNIKIHRTKHGYRTMITDKIKKIRVLGNVKKTKKESIKSAKEAYKIYEI